MSDPGLLLFLYTETPLHVGSGMGLGAVDLPIIREKLSELPLVPGSGLKGALRELFPKGDLLTDALFGTPPKEQDEDEAKQDEDEAKDEAKAPDPWAGAMTPLDVRLLLLPVRSIFGGFAWVTSPLVCHRLARDVERLSGALPKWSAINVKPERDLPTALVGPHTVLAQRNELLLEDLPYRPVNENKVEALAQALKEALPEGSGYDAFRKRLPEHLMVVSDQEFAELAKRHTEIVTRTRIDHETGTVAKRQLWTEENLPAESLLWGALAFERSHYTRFGYKGAAFMREQFINSEVISGRRRLRLGGNRTVGRGLVGLQILEGAELLTKEERP